MRHLRKTFSQREHFILRRSPCSQKAEVLRRFNSDPRSKYYTILYYTILYYTILYYTILYYTILYYAILYHTILCYTILNYTVVYYTTPYYTMLYSRRPNHLAQDVDEPRKISGAEEQRLELLEVWLWQVLGCC